MRHDTRYPDTRSLTEEERRLWRYVTRHDEPLHGRAPEEEPVFSASSPREAPALRRYRTAAARGTAVPPRASETSPTLPETERHVAGQLRSGRLPIEATLDLHFLYREQAHRALTQFIHTQAAMGRRCLLVITGKGSRGESAGVLRRSLPLWLEAPELRPLVVSCGPAAPRHGGAGAFYVLLKRARPHG